MSDGRKDNEASASGESSPAAGVGGLAFGPFVAFADTGRLLESGRAVSLAPKPFETLYYLARHAGRVVPKTELKERIWPGTFVTDDVVVQCVVDIRRALRDPAKRPQYVETIPRRGYRFVAAVHEAHASDADSPPGLSPDAPAAEAVPASPEPEKAASGRRRWWWTAGLTLALLGGVFGWVVWPGLEGAPQLSHSPAADQGLLLVLPLTVEEAAPGSGPLRQDPAEMIRSQLGKSRGIRLVARSQLAAALAEAGYSEETGPSAEGVSRVARRLRAEKLVTGSFVRVGNQFVLTAEVADVATGRGEGSASVRGRHTAELNEAVEELCLKLLPYLTTSPGPRPAGSRPGG